MDETKRKGPGSRGSAHDVEVKIETEKKVGAGSEGRVINDKQQVPASVNQDKNQAVKDGPKEHSISIENKDKVKKSFSRKDQFPERKRYPGKTDVKFKPNENRQSSFQYQDKKVNRTDRYEKHNRFDDNRKFGTNDLTRDVENLKKKFFEQQNLISELAKQKNDIKPIIASIIALIASIVAVFFSILSMFRH
ncbi:hypothetical protein JW890_01775 [candidate division WOR-3 bacterium]|nr:hypothetical protein [candidate division WOR-3 bacterium]